MKLTKSSPDVEKRRSPPYYSDMSFFIKTQYQYVSLQTKTIHCH